MRETASISMKSIPDMSSTTPPHVGTQPPAQPVPEPLTVIGTPQSDAAFIVSETSASDFA